MNKTNEKMALLFMSYISEKYDWIETYFKAQAFNAIKNNKGKYKTKFDRENLHESIIRTHDRILQKGFSFTNNNMNLSGACFLNFLFISMRNNVMRESQLNKKFINVDDIDISHDEVSERERFEKELFEIQLINEIFEWIDQKFNDSYESKLDVKIFKMYFRTSLSLQDVADLSTYSIGRVYKSVKRIRTAVNDQFYQKHKLTFEERTLKGAKT